MSARRLRALARILLILAPAAVLFAAQEPPLFENYEVPRFSWGGPDQFWWYWSDVVFYTLALGLATWLLLYRRSRRGVWLLMLACLAWFGFVRHGCICPVGATGFVSEAVAMAAPIAWTTVLLFIIPLAFALCFGRVFCGAVCPLGAIQDAVSVTAWRVPSWLDHALGLLAYVYLGLAVLAAAACGTMIICDYDPFVALFRLGGEIDLVLLGLLFILLAVFIGRPYCRFFCPYGVLLRICSFLSLKHLTIYPDKCTRCRLCEDSCPYGAIIPADPNQPKGSRVQGKGLLVTLLLLVPVLVASGAFGGSFLADPLSRLSRTVRLADQLAAEDAAAARGTALEPTDESQDFRDQGSDFVVLGERVHGIHRRFRIGSWLLGAFIGLVIGLKLVTLSVRRRRDEYIADPATCLSCGRCYPYCPRTTGCAPVVTADITGGAGDAAVSEPGEEAP